MSENKDQRFGLQITGKITVRRNGKIIAVRELEPYDLVLDEGRNHACGQVHDTGDTTYFNWIVIGTNATAPAASDTYSTFTIAMQEAGTYAKDAGTGVCSLDNTFTIDGTYALNECGITTGATDQKALCRDTYSTINVVANDTVTVEYTVTYTAP